MSAQQKVARILYQKLLKLYPGTFRERFGSSMLQTFNDLCNERQHEGGQRWVGFVAWLFIETVGGVIDEHAQRISFQQFRQGVLMKTITMDLRVAALVSFLLMLPFTLLELLLNEATRRNLVNFPLPLFGLLWILPTIFLVILLPIVRDLRTSQRMMAKSLPVLCKVAGLALLAFLWVAVVNDQMPCFLGVPNCD